MYRDLEAIHAKQYALDHPAIEQTDPLPSQNDEEVPETLREETVAATQGAGSAEAKQEDDSFTEEIVGAEQGPAGTSETSFASPAKSQDLVVNPVDDITQVESQEDQAKLDAQQNQEGEKKLNDKTDAEVMDSGSAAGAPDASNGVASGDALDFDSMFGVEAGGQASNDNPDLNFDDMFSSNAGGGNQSLDFGDDAELDLSSFGDQANNGNDDVTAMLEGLNNFGDTGNDDFSMLNMAPGDDANAQSTVKEPGNPNGQDGFEVGGGDLDMALGLENNESAFDDLLDGIDFGDGGDDGAGLNTMDNGEFDDAFFNID